MKVKKKTLQSKGNHAMVAHKTLKRNKGGDAIEHPDYVPKHYIGVNAKGHRVSFTQSKAEWVASK